MANAVLNRDIYWLDTTISLSSIANPENIAVGHAAMIGAARNAEIVRVDGWNPDTGILTIARGCLDTVPQRWTRSAQIWFYQDYIGTDSREYAQGESIAVKVLPRTTSNKLPMDESPVYGVTFDARFVRPYAPGNVKINGNPFYAGAIVGGSGDTTGLNLTWAHRDRVGQNDKVIDHLMGDIGPEAGVQYVIDLYGSNGVKFASFSTTDNHFELPYDWFRSNITEPGTSHGLGVALYSVRDGWESWQGYSMPFTITLDQMQAKQLMRILASPAQWDDGGLIVPPDAPDNQTRLSAGFIYEWAYYSALAAGRADLSYQVGTAMLRDPKTITGSDYGVATAVQGSGETLRERATATFAPAATVTGWPPTYNQSGALIPKDIKPFDTQVYFRDGTSLGGMKPGALAMLSEASNGRNAEVVQVVDIDFAHGSIKLKRGCLDTIPASHASGTTMWFFERNALGSDGRNYLEDQTVNTDLIAHQQQVYETGVMPELIEARSHRPYPPGLFRINDNPWFVGANVQKGYDTIFTWEPRDRLSQATTVVDHFATDCNLEPGCFYRLTMKAGDDVLADYQGTDPFYFYSAYQAQLDQKMLCEKYPGPNGVDYHTPQVVQVELTTVSPDGYESYQPYRTAIVLVDPSLWDGQPVPGSPGLRYNQTAIAYEIPYAPLASISGAADTLRLANPRISYIGTNSINDRKYPCPGYKLAYTDGTKQFVTSDASYPFTTGVAKVEGYPLVFRQDGVPIRQNIKQLDAFMYCPTLAGTGWAVGDMLFLGLELVVITSVDPAHGVVGIQRGCYDTIPAIHGAGTLAWRWQTICNWADDGKAHYFEDKVYLAFMPDLPGMTVPQSDTRILVIASARQTRPYPPAQVVVSGQRSMKDGTQGPRPWFDSAVISDGGITLSWVGRNRITQQMTPYGHTDPDVAEENGTTYRVRVMTQGPTGLITLRTYAGLTGHSMEYAFDAAYYDRRAAIQIDYDNLVKNGMAISPKPNLDDNHALLLRLESIRDGIECWQPYDMWVFVVGPYQTPPGQEPSSSGPWPSYPTAPPPYPPPGPPGSNPSPGTPDPHNPDSTSNTPPDENNPADPHNPPPDGDPGSGNGGGGLPPQEYGWGLNWSRGWDKGEPFVENPTEP